MILHFCPECQQQMFYQRSDDVIMLVGWFCMECHVFIEDDDYYYDVQENEE